MVWGVVQNFRASLKYRGGWKGLIDHMYTNGDYPFKFGSYMGCDAAGNRYYENRVDYPFGQHRWVEPGDSHNFDSSSIAPEWHGWMTSMNDEPPQHSDMMIDEKMKSIPQMCRSDNPMSKHVGHTEPISNFHNMHNQSQVRSRGYGIGNPVVGLPPFAKDAYYSQPGSPYNDSSRVMAAPIGDLDGAKSGGRAYKSLKWKERLMTPEEKAEKENKKQMIAYEGIKQIKLSLKQQRLAEMRGSGTIVGA